MNQRGNGARDSPTIQSTTSSTSASTPSTVIHLSTANIADDADSSAVTTHPDPPSVSNLRLASTARVFRGENLRPETRIIPTSNSFLINRHKLLRKTEEGKILQEGGTLTGARLSNSDVAAAPITPGKRFVLTDANKGQPETDNTVVANVKVAEKSDEDISERSAQQEYVSRSDAPSAASTVNPTDDLNSTASVHWSPRRPEVPPKPQIFNSETTTTTTTTSETTNKKVDELIAKQKQGRGILRVPSLSRSRTPSRGPSEERPAKKKEEHLHETVVYTKVKPELPANPPLNGNRHFLLRGNRPSVTRVEVSPPQPTVISGGEDTQTTVAALQIKGPRAPSPSPQRAVVIPSPVQSRHNRVQSMINQKPLPNPEPVAPVYKRLSEARTMAQTNSIETTNTPRMESSSPANSFIRPQIRPIPPRKPVKTDMTESLMEVLPNQMKRQAPDPPPVVHRQQIIVPSPSNVLREQQINLRNNFSPVPNKMGITSLRIDPGPNNYRAEVETPSFGGQMTFDDEYGSVMSSQMMDYDHSDDDHDDLVKRSLVKASNRRTRIEDIQEEAAVVHNIPVEPAPAVRGSNLQPDYDRLPQRPVRVVRKPSFLSSADESDNSRGHVTTVRTGEIVSRTSRKEQHPNDTTGTSSPTPRDESAGRRKYNERRLVQRNFEDDLQRRRVHSSTANSYIDSESIADRDDGFTRHSHNSSNTHVNNNATQDKFQYRRPGLTPSARSRYADRDSDDGASDSVGIPEPLPEYEYPNRIQGRTIKEVQEIRETVRLRNDSSSSSSPGRHSPSRRLPPKQDHHFSRHFDITPEELNTARSLIHHRLPPGYNEPPQPVMSQNPMPRQDSRFTPPSARHFDQFARPPAQSPARVRASPFLPPPSPNFSHHNVHHSDGEGRAYLEKPKKKMGIVRRLSELVRGEKKYKGDAGRIRNSSTSSMEEPQENLPPQILAARRQSPVRRYNDTPYRPPVTPLPVERTPQMERGHREQFNRPVQRTSSNRYSANFSDNGTAASFMYQEPQAPVYAQPNKLQKQQNLRYRSMSEYDLNRGPPDIRPDVRYENPMKSSKSIESLTESVWRQRSPGPGLGLFERNHDRHDGGRGRGGLVRLVPSREQSSERVFKTKLIPVGKGLHGDRPPDVPNAAYGLYDKRAKQYNSTPVLPTSNQVSYQMAPPIKPPRRYDYDSANRSSDSDPPPPHQQQIPYRRRMENEERSPDRIERAAPEQDLRVVGTGLYSEPDIPRRPVQQTVSSSGGDDTPPRQRFQARSTLDNKRYGTTESLKPLRSTENMPPNYARTRIAANDYTNRRYQSAAAEINVGPREEASRRFVGREKSVPVERQYKSSYKLQMNSQPAERQSGGTLVQERSRLFNNPPAPRRDYAVRR